MSSIFLRFPGGKAKAVTLSYDDGVEQDMQLVSIMRKHGLKGTFNINAGIIAPEGTVHPEGQIHRRMTATQILEAYPADICEVACHSFSHPFLERCTSSVLCREILDDRKVLEALFGRQIHGMAYPYGTFNDTVVDALKLCGIYYSRTTVSTERFDMPNDWLRMPATCHHNNPRLMELVTSFLSSNPNRTPQLFYLWGHAYEFERDNNWHVIEKFAETIGGIDDIWYATNMEIFLAWQDFQRLEYSADGKTVSNPSVRDVWIADHWNNIFKIGPGETVHI